MRYILVLAILATVGLVRPVWSQQISSAGNAVSSHNLTFTPVDTSKVRALPTGGPVSSGGFLSHMMPKMALPAFLSKGPQATPLKPGSSLPNAKLPANAIPVMSGQTK